MFLIVKLGRQKGVLLLYNYSLALVIYVFPLFSFFYSQGDEPKHDERRVAQPKRRFEAKLCET